MVCPSCGAAVADEQRFCQDCGGSLAGVTDATLRTEAALEPTAEWSPPWTPPPVPTPPGAATTEPWPETAPVAVSTDDLWASTRGDLAGEAIDPDATTPIATPDDATVTATYPVTVRVFDGIDDLDDGPEPRQPYRVRVTFLLALLATVVAVLVVFADVTDVRTSRPVGGIDTGVRQLDAFGTNLAGAVLFGCGVMVVGGFAACFGLRWGAGLAGGAGLAVTGWAALTIGLAEVPIAVATSIARNGTGEVFTLTVTRDLGYWLVVALGVIGVLVGLASLRLAGTGRRPALNPWVAAIGAIATLAFAVGPMIPMGDAVLRDNFRSTNPLIDLPTAWFAGRLAQVALIALGGVVGFLLVRSYGLGLAAGGLSVGAWMIVTATAEAGERPLGVAGGNIGAVDVMPHSVTVVALALSATTLLLACALALLRR